MHCIVPFAAPGSEAGRAALATMQWPRLQALLPRLALVDRDEGEPTTFSPPHERVLARALGWQGDDGCWPFAARAARADGIDPGDDAWGLVSPVHWHLGTDQVSLADPEALQLDEAGARTLFEAVRPLFEDEGLRLAYGHATRWYVAHESLRGLRTAALDRVVGRNVDPWLDDGGGGGDGRGGRGGGITSPLRRWRRLQAEVQMLLHSHPLNAAREAAGLPPVNSFWLSGCGRAQPEGSERPVQIDTTLRTAALAEDWPAWSAGWRRLEEGTLLGLDIAMRRGSEVWLTLAGERAALTFTPLRGGLVARLKNVLARPSVPALLASL
ncbi:MAG: hypothetical protein HZC37_30245 [Burkholderiales bacterium]|nr:hypothetical protein [Burkholderiales bacterium]